MAPLRGRLLLPAIVVVAAIAGTATAAGPVVLASRDVTLAPSGSAIRLVAGKANLDRRRGGRVALWLSLHRKVGSLGYRKVEQVRVATGFKLSSRLVWLRVGRTAEANTAAVRVRWLISPSVGKRTYSFLATRTRLVRKR